MRHDLHLAGLGFALRPVGLEDAEFLVELRTDPERAKLLHATSPRIEDQITWTEHYFERPGDWYFMVESVHDGQRHGAVAIYNHDPERQSAEWGRWILHKGSLAAVESSALIYDMAFDQLGLDLLYSRTEEVNYPVVSFHTSMGCTTNGLVIGPEGERWIEQQMLAADWPTARRMVEPKIAAAAAFAKR